jgi:DNA-binding transcriptional ArsR family regulator
MRQFSARLVDARDILYKEEERFFYKEKERFVEREHPDPDACSRDERWLLRPMERQKQPLVDPSTVRPWTFLTNHAQLLLAMARKPEATVCELAETLQVTERSVYRILADLQKAGYVERQKVGRHNRYEINPAVPLGDVSVENQLVRDLLQLIRPAGA